MSNVSILNPDREIKLFKKQRLACQNSNARINMWDGSVSSGKTYASVIKWIEFILTAPPGDMLMIGRTARTLERNVLSIMFVMLGIYIDYKKSYGYCIIFGRKVYIEGASDSRAENKIRGMTLIGAYLDEMTLINEDMFKMCLSRLRLSGARLYGTTNPDSPYHFIKKEYIENEELDLVRFHFHIDDNEFLPPEYVENIKKEYTGLFYKRFIEGLWVLAEGAIYDFFDEDEHSICGDLQAQKWGVGIDYGTSNPTVFILFGSNMNTFPNIWAEKEYYYDSKEHNRQKTDDEYVDDLIDFMNGYDVSQVVVDPSAASFKNACLQRGIYTIEDANNDVLNGIRYQQSLLNKGVYKVHRRCKHTILDYSSYVWDKKSSLLGEDRPIKMDDHTKDAERYFLYTAHYNDIYSF